MEFPAISGEPGASVKEEIEDGVTAFIADRVDEAVSATGLRLYRTKAVPGRIRARIRGRVMACVSALDRRHARAAQEKAV